MSQNLTREEFKGDFLGFTFDDYHSSIFGIVRTSQSDRYNENLLPTIQDKTVQVPGGDGTYYFGSYYTQRQFTINFAFDSMTEKQLRRLREVFGDRKIHDLIFDEVPYKIYSAKCTGTSQVKYLCFDEQVVDEEGNVTTERRYKGEGTLQFTAFYPFARGRFKYIDEEVKIIKKDLDGEKTYKTLSAQELMEDSNFNYKGLFPNKPKTRGIADVFPVYTKEGEKVTEISGYITNYGDKESWFELAFPIYTDSKEAPYLTTHSMKIYLNPRKDENGKEKYDGFLHLRPLSWEEVKQCVENGEESIKINSKNNIIESCTITVSDGKNYHNSTGKIYNNLVLEGSFFQISKGTSYLKIVPGDEYIKSIPNISSPPTLTKLPIEVDLNYTYLYY